MNNLSAEEVEEKVIFIQKQWSNSIIEIGKAYKEKKNYFELTNQFLDKLYFLIKEKYYLNLLKHFKNRSEKIKASLSLISLVIIKYQMKIMDLL